MHEIQVCILIAFAACLVWEVGYTQEPEYAKFIDKLAADEPYIGLFAVEEKLIAQRTPEYLKARKKCFIDIKDAKEEPYDHVERFIKFCLDNGYLNPENKEEW